MNTKEKCSIVIRAPASKMTCIAGGAGNRKWGGTADRYEIHLGVIKCSGIRQWWWAAQLCECIKTMNCMKRWLLWQCDLYHNKVVNKNIFSIVWMIKPSEERALCIWILSQILLYHVDNQTPILPSTDLHIDLRAKVEPLLILANFQTNGDSRKQKARNSKRIISKGT